MAETNRRRSSRTARPKSHTQMSLLKCVTALNHAEEKATFFASASGTYNPQFRYCWSTAACPDSLRPQCIEERTTPSDEHLTNAIRILKNTIAKYGSYTEYEERYGGALLTRKGCSRVVKQYLEANSMKTVHLRLNSSLSSRGTFSNGKDGPTLCLRPEGCREKWLHGTLDHELGTHYLRFANERKQPWHGRKGRRAYGCSNKNPTEEGLAALHTVLSRPGHCMWRAAMNYYAAYMGHSLTFCELFVDLKQFCVDDELRWDFSFRVKRGYEDTGVPGAFCKDQMYLDGAVNILKHRETIDFVGLYMGQIALQDLERLRPGGEIETLELPSFLSDMEEYRRKLSDIVRENGIDLCQL